MALEIIYILTMTIFTIPFILWAWFNHSKSDELFGIGKWKLIPIVFAICIVLIFTFLLIAAFAF